MKEKNRECYFDKETTSIIKGILLILMFISINEQVRDFA